MTEGLTAEAVLDPAAVLRVHFTRNNFYDRGHCQECRAEFPCVPAQLARQLLETQNALRALLDHHSAHRYHWEDFTNDCPDANATARLVLAEHTETPRFCFSCGTPDHFAGDRTHPCIPHAEHTETPG